ncbi:hypothetical protein F8G81_09980 [Arthrobacter sp. CDRTa11]|uniref:hypothetical protein n=1 Tax=Arthrobacter sp. CDRTa11 TaxID=2651199 RepID=UPI002265AA2E|nr:hypothetical protein [Arthrobacter sp. CDRTa11]UZX02897.1 hypothetical protein F8G81_09980 [Arthrobacter sp. CDRTa11]
MTGLVAELVKCNGPDTATELAIASARQHFTILHSVAQVINIPVDELLAALEPKHLENTKYNG